MTYSSLGLSYQLSVSPPKHSQHIGIMTLSASSECHPFGFPSITLEAMHQFYSNLIEG